MRLDRSRLENGGFPYTFKVEPRFSDLDKLGHINNVAVALIFQEARNRFFRASKVYSAAQCDVVVASSLIEYAADLLYPDPIDVSVGVLEVGRSSIRFGQIASQNGRIGAYAEVVQVARNNAGSVPLPDAWRAELQTLRIAQG